MLSVVLRTGVMGTSVCDVTYGFKLPTTLASLVYFESAELAVCFGVRLESTQAYQSSCCDCRHLSCTCPCKYPHVYSFVLNYAALTWKEIQLAVLQDLYKKKKKNFVAWFSLSHLYFHQFNTFCCLI